MVWRVNKFNRAVTVLFYFTSVLLSIVIAAVTYVLNMGVQNWFRRSIYEKTPMKEIFRPFSGGRLWSNIGMCLLIQLFTFLWSLLFIVPGIVKALGYSMAMYIVFGVGFCSRRLLTIYLALFMFFRIFTPPMPLLTRR